MVTGYFPLECVVMFSDCQENVLIRRKENSLERETEVSLYLNTPSPPAFGTPNVKDNVLKGDCLGAHAMELGTYLSKSFCSPLQATTGPLGGIRVSQEIAP